MVIQGVGVGERVPSCLVKSIGSDAPRIRQGWRGGAGWYGIILRWLGSLTTDTLRISHMLLSRDVRVFRVNAPDLDMIV